MIFYEKVNFFVIFYEKKDLSVWKANIQIRESVHVKNSAYNIVNAIFSIKTRFGYSLVVINTLNFLYKLRKVIVICDKFW